MISSNGSRVALRYFIRNLPICNFAQPLHPPCRLPEHSPRNRKQILTRIIVITCSVLGCILALTILFAWFARRLHMKREKQRSRTDSEDVAIECRRYPKSTIEQSHGKQEWTTYPQYSQPSSTHDTCPCKDSNTLDMTTRHIKRHGQVFRFHGSPGEITMMQEAGYPGKLLSCGPGSTRNIPLAKAVIAC